MFSLESLKWRQGEKWVCLFDCGFLQKFKPEKLWILLLQVFGDLAYNACQHCPHLWMQDRILGNLYLWLLLLVCLRYCGVRSPYF